MSDKLEAVEAAKQWRRDEVQALGAALSCRDWYMMEQAYNRLRDKMDNAFIDWSRTPTPEQAGEVEQIIRWVDQAIERADKHGNTEGMWLFAKQWKAVRDALQSTPPAQPTADYNGHVPNKYVPPLPDGCSLFAVNKTAGAFYYINHAGTWQSMPPLRTPTPEQAGEVERLREAIKLTVSDASFHLKKYRPHCLEALEAALQSTPTALSTEVKSGSAAFHESPVSSKVAQPTADAVGMLRAEADRIAGLYGDEVGMTDARVACEMTLREMADRIATMAGDYVMVPREALADLIDETIMLLTPKGNVWTGNEADWQVAAHTKATEALDMLSASPTGGE